MFACEIISIRLSAIADLGVMETLSAVCLFKFTFNSTVLLKCVKTYMKNKVVD